MQTPRWYWNRIKRMSPGEISYRVHNLVLAHAQRRGLYVAKVPAPIFPESLPTWIHKDPNINSGLCLKDAQRVVMGTVNCFAIEDAVLGEEPVWNRDPLTGRVAPLQFGKTMDYRDENLVGDIKYLWEINRHLQLVTLAQAYMLSEDVRYLEVLKKQLDSWIIQCPYLQGPNWASSLELGIRLINWCIVWQLIGGKDSPLFADAKNEEFLQRWLDSIFQHAHFIQGHFSRYSSANNHLIGEAAGLYVATVTWPFWNDFVSWQRQAKRILEEEALRQNTPDGVNREQAVSYQQFVLDFLVISGLAARANGSDFSADYWKRIEAMLEYLASIMDVAGNVPMIGDADDGYVVRLSQEHDFCPYRSLLATGAVLFNRGDFKHKAQRLDDKTRWLLGKDGEEKFAAIESADSGLPARRRFPYGGYHVLGADFETEDEVRMIVDAGPLGYLSLAAHGHADALALTLSISGREFLVDPGTYAYHTRQKWRDYFRGTSAHNTVRIDQKNQSVIAGNFMWSTKANADCDVWESNGAADYLVVRHDGYLRLADPVLHRREIRLDKVEHDIAITDHLECRGDHLVEQFWHFSEDCEVSLRDNEITATNGSVVLSMEISGDNLELTLYKAQEEPPLGWVSRRFDVKVPATTVVAKTRVRGNSSVVANMKWKKLP